MRKLALLALAPILAIGLHAQTPTGAAAPLQVKVLPPSSWTNEPLRFELNEPGYVAAFMIYPGHGVRMIYPEYTGGQEQLWSAGYHGTQLNSLSYDNDVYDMALSGYGFGPSYLYVIASRNPLNVSRFIHRPALLASAIGQTSARSFLIDVEFDALVNNAIALGSDATWDADSYMLWPSDRLETPRSTYAVRYLMCVDGTIRAVPENYPFIACGHRQRVYQTYVPTVLGRQVAHVSPPTVLPSIVGDGKRHPQVKAPTPVPSVTAFTAAGPLESTEPRRPRRMHDGVEWTNDGGVWVSSSAAPRFGERGGDHAGDRGMSHRERPEDGRGRFSGGTAAPFAHTAPGMTYTAPRLAPAPGFSGGSSGAERVHSESSAPRAEPRAETPRAAPAGASKRAQ